MVSKYRYTAGTFLLTAFVFIIGAGRPTDDQSAKTALPAGWEDTVLKSIEQRVGNDWKSLGKIPCKPRSVCVDFQSGKDTATIEILIAESVQDAESYFNKANRIMPAPRKAWDEPGMDQASRFGPDSGTVFARRGVVFVHVGGGTDAVIRKFVRASLDAADTVLTAIPATRPTTEPDKK